jgi:hypothetical protein
MTTNMSSRSVTPAIRRRYELSMSMSVSFEP